MFEYPTICPFCGGTSIESAEENISTLGDPEMNGSDVFDLIQFICTQCDKDFFCARERNMVLVECEICGKKSVSDGTVWWSCDCHDIAYKFLKPLELKDPADKDIDSEDPIYGVPI